MKTVVITIVSLLILFGCVRIARCLNSPSPSARKIESEPESQSKSGTQKTKSQHTRAQESAPIVNQINTFQAEKESSNAAEEKKEQATINWRVMVFTGFLAFVAFLQLLTLGWQVLAYQNSERAWVLVSMHDKPIKAEPGVYVIPTVTNCGRTTARITKFALRWHPVESPEGLPPSPDYGRETAADFVIPPNAPITPMSVLVPEKDYRDAEDIRTALYIYGFIDYKGWWRKRKTRFCFMHYPGPSTMPLPPGFYVGIQAPPAYTKTT